MPAGSRAWPYVQASAGMRWGLYAIDLALRVKVTSIYGSISGYCGYYGYYVYMVVYQVTMYAALRVKSSSIYAAMKPSVSRTAAMILIPVCRWATGLGVTVC